MTQSIASIHRCVKYLLGHTQKSACTGVEQEAARAYSLNGIKKSLSEICAKSGITSLTEQDLWEQYFLKDEPFRIALERRKIQTMEELLFRTKEYYADNNKEFLL